MFLSFFALLFSLSMASNFDLQQEKGDDRMISIIGTWHINRIEIDGELVRFPQGVHNIDINILQDRITGNAGCNSYMLPYSLDSNGKIIIKDGGLTKKMCDIDIMKFENAFLDIFHDTFSIQKSFGTIMLIGNKATLYITK